MNWKRLPNNSTRKGKAKNGVRTRKPIEIFTPRTGDRDVRWVQSAPEITFFLTRSVGKFVESGVSRHQRTTVSVETLS